MLRFNSKYFLFTIILFLVEVCIALFVHDSFVRPFFGDFLVVILVYCFIKSFLDISIVAASIVALLFSYFVETLQYLNIVEILGLQNSNLARTVIGTSFAWEDIVAYTLGIVFIFFLERKLASPNSTHRQPEI
ncbi:ribosomal maturation YjgA family protein [Persicitalea jodogahamensis]|uniref:Membrane protein n=1 Tax=Persicitalea jodogahamensis TaxID=402147 RepID=A0A8J3GCJ0_9BACT|nr:DUF2809 domain-containing protein [Persicitalea jodogahamensis]GHB85081.1 membrane protein [Persicitalea jodogahamensis]